MWGTADGERPVAANIGVGLSVEKSTNFPYIFPFSI